MDPSPLRNSTDLALAWVAMLWFDTTIFVLTFIQAIRMRRLFPGGLLEVIFRDGECVVLARFRAI